MSEGEKVEAMAIKLDGGRQTMATALGDHPLLLAVHTDGPFLDPDHL